MSFIVGNMAKKWTFQRLIIKPSEKTFLLEYIREWIIETVQNRLYDSGEDSEGQELQTDIAKMQRKGFNYSLNTRKIKRSEGKKFSNVTLKDTGEFYESWQIAAKKTFAEIKANFKKDGGNIFENFQDSYTNQSDFEKKILSLSTEEMNVFLKKIFLPQFMQFIKIEKDNIIKESR